MDNNTNNNFATVNISSELKKHYIDYAMSVIVSRAIPDVRDGLKPVQRRILYAMYKMGIFSNSGYKKVARIVGEVIGKYHPHGDASVSGALVRMAQEFNMRYPLIDGQGNFGSIDGDPPAAMRYIEAKLSEIGEILLEDVEDTVDYQLNYDGNEQEPVILPAKVPNILMNGAEGIAVGMSTKIPPHNLTEIIQALIYLIDSNNNVTTNNLKIDVDYDNNVYSLEDIKKLSRERFIEFKSYYAIEDILVFLKGPDFPTKGNIFVSQKELIDLYKTGKGTILIQGICTIEESKDGKYKIIVTELPYKVNKAQLITRIAELYKNKKIEGISDLRDESNKEGIRIVIELKKGVNPIVVRNQLFKYTELQKSIASNLLVLVKGQPKYVSLKEILEAFISHRIEVIMRKKEIYLVESRHKLHILEGLVVAVKNIDDIVNIIKQSKEQSEAKQKLMQTYNLSEVQAQAILDLQLKKLVKLEISKLEEEYNQIKNEVSSLLKLLSSYSNILELIKIELQELKEKYGDKRKSNIIIKDEDKSEISLAEEDIVQNEEVIVTISKDGFIKRIKAEAYKIQNKGGKGSKALDLKETDYLKHIVYAKTHDNIMFFTSKGKVYTTKTYKIPDMNKNTKGISIFNLVNLEQNENITSVLTNKKDTNTQNQFLLIATKLGIVKKTNIQEFQNIRSSGIKCINLDESKQDEIVSVKTTTGNN
ncbi:MAG: DNA gyrase subunit A, partial [Candidatus Dojkabacteria bacterium]|nr:DNA gyrase subunit A [Candidatus Dojkabacteria bacterium]